MVEAATLYKKQDGKLSVSADGRTVSWKSNNGTLPPLTITIADITNLQQTPEKAAKVSIKLVLQKPGAAEPENHTFNFTSPTARADQVAIVGELRKNIEAARASKVTTPVPPPDDGGQPAAMAIAQAVAAGETVEDNSLDDAKLIANAELQKSLLNSDAALRQRFDQALREKPDIITISQFATQFWATRTHILRSHAVERMQNQGTYNVLSEVKPKNVDGTVRLNLSKEQIQLIFNQHPLVKRVYNENVPQINEMDFWSRFFVSRLFKKLKGEKITDADSIDPKLDKYLNAEDETSQTFQFNGTMPLFVNLEGNEQNSVRFGNQPDWTMRPNSHDKVPILRVLNRMSEKMMADVPPSDKPAHDPAGMDEETYKELELRDLQKSEGDNRVYLNIQHIGQLFSANQAIQESSSAAVYSKRTPSQAISAVQNDIHAITGSKRKAHALNLESTIGVEDDSSSDEEDQPKKKMRIGGTRARRAGMSHIMKSVKQGQFDSGELSTRLSSQVAAQLGLSETVFDMLEMTHNTTVEFLHYFWTVYHSGDPDRAVEIQKLVETLDKSLDRIEAVEKAAEEERNVKIEKAEEEVQRRLKSHGRRLKYDKNKIPGGGKVVRGMMGPVLRAIGEATGCYRRTLEAQMAQMAALQSTVL